MNITFRVDASIQIGIGHIMRCLTLADALKAQGAECRFICREHPGNLIEHVRGKGYVVHSLPACTEPVEASLLAIKTRRKTSPPFHSYWLGTTQEQDVEACAMILAELQPDWLIVDHYALDACWELALKPHYQQLMVIDDLADRPHACHLLLDQTFGRNAEDYRALVPANCQLLCGSHYALLRPEFAALRADSLQRRKCPQLEHLLITMGGVDKGNASGQVLQALKSCELPVNCHITVAMGATAPWLADVSRQAEQMPWPTRVKVDVSDMARLMADSDLAIGAAGATSWERCCLGLPTIMLVLADNQRYAASLLDRVKVVKMLSLGPNLASDLAQILEHLRHDHRNIQDLIKNAQTITDGTGCQVVADMLNKLSNE